MQSDQAVEHLKLFRKDFAEAIRTVDSGQRVEWDSHTYYVMFNVISDILTNYFYIEELEDYLGED